MSETMEFQLKDELNPGETIEWSGKPNSGIIIKTDDVIPLLINLIFIALAFFFLRTIFINGISPLGVLLFLLVGSLAALPFFSILAGTLFFQPHLRKNRLYVVTNQRIIILTKGKNINIKSVRLDAIRVMNINVRKDGQGTLRLGEEINTPWSSRHTRSRYYFVDRSVFIPEFEMIENAKNVYDLIKKLQSTMATTNRG